MFRRRRRDLRLVVGLSIGFVVGSASARAPSAFDFLAARSAPAGATAAIAAPTPITAPGPGGSFTLFPGGFSFCPGTSATGLSDPAVVASWQPDGSLLWLEGR